MVSREKVDISQAKRLVIKVGTSTLTHETGHVNIRRFESFVKVLADLKNSGKEIILVSSGAMAVGRSKLGMLERPSDMPTKQATAAIGQGELMHLYDTEFSRYHHIAAQILLTKDVVDERLRREHVVNTFRRLLDLNCIPIVNENDTVSVEEIEFGDNDSLSATVAILCQADVLIILSDIDGLFDADPHHCPNAKRIPFVQTISQELLQMASGSGSNRGTGGMITKLHAAQKACEQGIPTVVMNGGEPENLYRLMENQSIGTYFHANKGELI